jgi:5'-nucleotidase / UDP-sugar diphosphatase
LDKVTNFTNALSYIFDDEIEDDLATKLAIDKWTNKLAEITDGKICLISQSLTRSYGEESLLGDMVADAIFHAFPNNDFTVTNSGVLREDIVGPIVTIGILISPFPFPNTVVQLEMNGKSIKEIFEHSAGVTNGVYKFSMVLQCNMMNICLLEVELFHVN